MTGLSLNPHHRHKSLIKLLRRIIPHLLLTVIHRGDLKDDGEVSSGADGDGQRGKLDAEDIYLLFVKSEAVVHLALYPGFKIDDKVYLFGVLYGAYTIKSLYVDDTDSAKFNIVAQDLGCLTDERFFWIRA